MKHLEILYGVSGQTIYIDPLEGQASGTPTAAVYLSTNDDGTTVEVATTGSCSVDSVSTTVSVSAVSGDTSLSLASTTGIARDRQYLVTNADGNREWVEVVGVTASAVTIRQPLVMDHASGATFKGCRISISILDSWAADASNITDVIFAGPSAWRTDQENDTSWPAGAAGYRVHWSYVVGGVTRVGISFFDLTRYQAKQLASPVDVDRRFPGWLDRLPVDDRIDQGTALIDEALQAVKLDALGDAQVLRRMRNVEVLRDLIIHKANVLAQEANALSGSVPRDAMELARQMYQQRYDQLIRSPKIPIDQTGGGASAQPQKLPAWQR